MGLPALRAHIWQVVGIGKTVTDRDVFDKRFKRAFPDVGDQFDLDLDLSSDPIGA